MFDFNLEDVLEEETVPRLEKSEQPIFETVDTSENEFSDLQFSDTHEEIEDDTAVIDNSPMTLQEAQENAEILVELLDTINTVTLTPLARWRAAKKRGGKAAIKRMQSIAEKEYAGQELTESEKLLLARYNLYLKDKEEIENEIPYSDEEKERLTKSATTWIKTKNIRVNGGLSFWGEFAMIQGIRIMQVVI